MADSPITRKMIEADPSSQNGALLERLHLRRHQAPGIEERSDLTCGVQKYIRSRHIRGVFCDEADHRLIDLDFDLIHQIESRRPLAPHDCTGECQISGASQEEGNTVRLSRCVRRRDSTAFTLVGVAIRHRPAPFEPSTFRNDLIGAPQTTGTTAYRTDLSEPNTDQSVSGSVSIRFLVAYESMTRLWSAVVTGGARG